VTLEEFKRFAVRDPIIMQAIQKLFGSGTVHDVIQVAAVETAEKTGANPLLIRPSTFYITRTPGDFTSEPTQAKDVAMNGADKMGKEEVRRAARAFVVLCCHGCGWPSGRQVAHIGHVGRGPSFLWVGGWVGGWCDSSCNTLRSNTDPWPGPWISTRPPSPCRWTFCTTS